MKVSAAKAQAAKSAGIAIQNACNKLGYICALSGEIACLAYGGTRPPTAIEGVLLMPGVKHKDRPTVDAVKRSIAEILPAGSSPKYSISPPSTFPAVLTFTDDELPVDFSIAAGFGESDVQPMKIIDGAQYASAEYVLSTRLASWFKLHVASQQADDNKDLRTSIQTQEIDPLLGYLVRTSFQIKNWHLFGYAKILAYCKTCPQSASQWKKVGFTSEDPVFTNALAPTPRPVPAVAEKPPPSPVVQKSVVSPPPSTIPKPVVPAPPVVQKPVVPPPPPAVQKPAAPPAPPVVQKPAAPPAPPVLQKPVVPPASPVVPKSVTLPAPPAAQKLAAPQAPPVLQKPVVPPPSLVVPKSVTLPAPPAAQKLAAPSAPPVLQKPVVPPPSLVVPKSVTLPAPPAAQKLAAPPAPPVLQKPVVPPPSLVVPKSVTLPAPPAAQKLAAPSAPPVLQKPVVPPPSLVVPKSVTLPAPPAAQKPAVPPAPPVVQKSITPPAPPAAQKQVVPPAPPVVQKPVAPPPTAAGKSATPPVPSAAQKQAVPPPPPVTPKPAVPPPPPVAETPAVPPAPPAVENPAAPPAPPVVKKTVTVAHKVITVAHKPVVVPPAPPTPPPSEPASRKSSTSSPAPPPYQASPLSNPSPLPAPTDLKPRPVARTPGSTTPARVPTPLVSDDPSVLHIPNPTRIQMLFMAAHHTVAMLRSIQLPCAIFGSMACFLYGNTRSPNDIDVLVIPRLDDQRTVEDVKATLALHDPERFFLINSKDPEAGYKILYYRLPGSDTSQTPATSCKVDLVFPGTLNLPRLPGVHINWDEGLPIIPFSLLLLQKLQGWDHHRKSSDKLKLLKQRTDVEDMKELFDLQIVRELKKTHPWAWADEELFNWPFLEESQLRVKALCEEFPEAALAWREVGFTV